MRPSKHITTTEPAGSHGSNHGWDWAQTQTDVAFDTPAAVQAPLCVDLDGTLLHGDILWEGIVSLFRTAPLALFWLPFWLMSGMARLKEEVARRGHVDVTTLPYHAEVMSFLISQREQGRTVILATAAEIGLAQRVADHLGVFDGVYATEEGRNLRGEAKAHRLREEFGEGGYDYIGDSPADVPVWKSSRAALVVGNQDMVRKAQAVAKVDAVFDSRPASLQTWLSALRIHHWVKNALLFLPLLLAHRFDVEGIRSTTIAFLLFGCCASSIYIVNDLLDLHSDRAHPWKSKRPFASGQTSIPDGLLISGLLAMATVVSGFLLNVQFGVVLVLYILTTLLYSVYLKKIVLLDVFVLSGFYVVRIWAGAVAASVPLSDWFLAFSLFFFLSLATAKRYSELVHAGGLVGSGKSGRAYVEADRALLMPLGVGSAFASVIILALYEHSQELLLFYRRPEALLLICPIILYWLSRVWLKAGRGELDDDPLTLSIHDPATYAVAAVILSVMLYSASPLWRP